MAVIRARIGICGLGFRAIGRTTRLILYTFGVFHCFFSLAAPGIFGFCCISATTVHYLNFKFRFTLIVFHLYFGFRLSSWFKLIGCISSIDSPPKCVIRYKVLKVPNVAVLNFRVNNVVVMLVVNAISSINSLLCSE